MGATAEAGERQAVNAGGSTAPRDRPHVFILSDVRLFREGLALLLPRDGSVVLAGAGSAGEAVNIVAGLKPDVLLLDATLGNLLACAQQVRHAVDGIKIVAFALSEVDQELIACAEAGARAFVGRDGSYQDLLCAIAKVWRGEFAVSPNQTALLLGRIAQLAETASSPSNPAGLTRREREIVPLIERGLSNKEIARHLSIGTATIKNHVHNILEKLQLNRRGEIGARMRGSSAARRRLAESAGDLRVSSPDQE
jgi:two-component system nitrate/nitrite response regulator NarL